MTSASLAETITYTYDAKGRLVRTVHAGAINSGVVTTYALDRADNRTNASVTGVGGAPAGDVCTVNVPDGDGNSAYRNPVKFYLYKSGTCSQAITINYQTRDGTARNGIDYYGGSGSIVFAPNETTKMVSFDTAGTFGVEMYLDVSVASGPGTLTRPTAIGYLFDGS